MRDLPHEDDSGAAGPGNEPRTTRTTCPYCGVGCGVVVKRAASGLVEVAGDPDHPANFGRLCSKGAALAETLSLDDRLLTPLVDGREVSWDAALDLVAARFAEAIAKHGPDSVAIYGSGQLLTEDYYVANKLMKGFIGSGNIDTNSRLCMASSVAGHKRAFGSDTVPGCYEDLEEADLVVLVGSNLAWCHPVLFQRLAAAREKRGTKIVVVDPRRTATCEIADMHLAIAPDTDVALFNGLFVSLVGANATNKDYIARHTSGFTSAFEAASRMPISAISRKTGIAQIDLFAFYDLFVRTERVVTVYSQGVNQSKSGVDKVNAIINCHLASGRIGKPGMGPFSVTGQPNAMGGREVGGLANMLAAHMEFDNPTHRDIVADFWQTTRLAEKPGLKAVDLFDSIAAGRIKALWILATNPVDSLPEADSVRQALKACPFVVVSDVSRSTDTTALAHVLLPSLAWGEKDGTVTNSERRISRQRAFLDSPGQARADWWQLAEVGRRMGWKQAFDYAGPAGIFAEHARLSAAANNGLRDFDISARAHLSAAEYDEAQPFQWPHRSGGEAGPVRFFADGNFFTPDRRARFVSTVYSEKAPAPAEYPLVLNTGRIRDQWHTMTRTAKTPRLMAHTSEPFVELNPADAALHRLEPADIASIASPHGSMLARVIVSNGQQPGSVFVPMHWTDQLSSRGRVDALVAPAVDPISGQPALKQAHVRVERFAAAFFAVTVTRSRPEIPEADYWALAPIAGGWRIEIAAAQPLCAETLFRALLGRDASRAKDATGYTDRGSGQARFAAFEADRLIGALYAGPTPVAVSRAWLSDRLAAPVADAAERLRILAGRPGDGVRDRGAVVCACLEVGRNDIVAAICSGSATVEAVGRATGAGTNCGSCRSEIGRLIDAPRLTKAG